MIHLTVDGSPEACRACTSGVRELASTFGAAGDALAQAMIQAAGAWSGDSFDAFTSVVKEQIRRCDAVHEELVAFAADVDGFAEDLQIVRSEMQRAHAIATRAGISAGNGLPEIHEITPLPGQEGPLDHAIGVATRARAHETAVQGALQTAIERIRAVSWEPSAQLGTAASSGPARSIGRLNTLAGSLGDLLPDRDDIPLPVGPLINPLKGVLSGLNLPSAREVAAGVGAAAGEVLPGGPKVAGLPLIAVMNPHMVQPLILLKQLKRIPGVAGPVNEVITGYAKTNTSVGRVFCKQPPLLRRVPVIKNVAKKVTHPVKPLVCAGVDHEIVNWYADLIVESTNAK